MTPEERAATITQGWRSIELAIEHLEFPHGVRFDGLHVADMVPVARQTITDAIRAAVAEEREACANVADGFCYPANDVGKIDGLGDEAESIAAAIRARDTPT